MGGLIELIDSHIATIISYLILIVFSYAIQVLTTKSLVAKTEEMRADQKENQKETIGKINTMQIEQAKMGVTVSNLEREFYLFKREKSHD